MMRRRPAGLGLVAGAGADLAARAGVKGRERNV